MKPTLRIAARHAHSAGLITSTWRTQGGATPSSLMRATTGRSGIGRNSGNSGIGGEGGIDGQRVKALPCAYGSTGFSSMPRHEIDTPIYREVAM